MVTGEPIPGQTPATELATPLQPEGQPQRPELRRVFYNKEKRPVSELIETARQYPTKEQLRTTIYDDGETYGEIRSGVEDALRNNPDYLKQVLDSYLKYGKVPDTVKLTIGNHLYSIAHEEPHQWGQGFKEQIMTIKRRVNDGASEWSDTDGYKRLKTTGEPYWTDHWGFSVDKIGSLRADTGRFSYFGPEAEKEEYYSNMTENTAFSAVKSMDLVNALKGEAGPLDKSVPESTRAPKAPTTPLSTPPTGA